MENRLTPAELGALSIPELYKIHQDEDAEVAAIRGYHQDIHDAICAKEAATREHGPRELAQSMKMEGVDIIEQMKKLPALYEKLRKHFTTGDK